MEDRATNQDAAPRTRSRRRRVVAVAVMLVAALAVAYLGAGALVYGRLAAIGAGCGLGGEVAGGTPAGYEIGEVDTAARRMPAYEEVTFPSREPGITISGWYVPSTAGVHGPAVVVVHGLGVCKRHPIVLLPAGMLHRQGFAVLLIDLRDHGDSTREDGRQAAGTEEYRDILGGWDHLVARGHRPTSIGLYGQSLGAASVLIAAGEEPRVAAVWEDSGFAALSDAIEDELERTGYPALLAPAGVLFARLVAGDDLSTLSPVGAVRRLGTRPLFITHGDADTRLDVRFATELADAYRAGGGAVEPWIVAGAEHLRAVILHPDEYEERLAAFFGRALGGR